MPSSGPEERTPRDARPEPTTFLFRLALVLVAAAAFLILFKPAASLENKLQAVLDAEVQAVRTGDREAFEALHDSPTGDWWEYRGALFDDYQEGGGAAGLGEELLFPAHHVVEAAAQTSAAWALVSLGEDPGAPRQVVFFRRVAGRWLLASPDPAYWGDPGVHQSLYFAWYYRHLDDAWVRELAPVVDAAWAQIAADLDVVLPSHLVGIQICYTLDCRLEQPRDSATRYVISLDEFTTRAAPEPNRSTAPASVRTLTPLLLGHHPASVERALARELARYLGALAVGGGGETRMVGSSVLLQAIYSWEAAHVTGHDPAWVAPVLARAVASGSLLSFDELSLIPDRASYELAAAEGYALVDYLVTHYRRDGLPILPDLLRAAGVRSGVSTALQDVFAEGTNISALEEQWVDYLRTSYGP